MPGQDRTGPQGLGPLTGRGFGPCGCRMQRGFGGGFGRGRGFGFFGYGNSITLTKADEKKILEAELKEIDLEKQEIAKRLKEIK